MRKQDLKENKIYKNLKTKRIFKILAINQTTKDTYVKAKILNSKDNIKYVHTTLDNFVDKNLEEI